MRAVPWLGPVRYPVVAAKRAYEIVLGKMLQTGPSTVLDVEVPYLKSASVQWAGVNVDADSLMWASPKELRNLNVARGDLVVCEGGDVGRAAVYAGPTGYIFQNSVHRVRARHGNDVRFFRYVLEAAHGSGWFDVLCNKATIRHLTGEKLGSLEIPLPLPDEQRRIAAFLDAQTDAIDSLLAIRGKQIRLVEERVRALRDMRVNDLSATWGTVPLRRYVRSIEQGVSPQCDAVPAGDKEWGVLKLSCIRRGTFVASENKRLPDNELVLSGNAVRRGDLLVTRANTPDLVGDVAVVDRGERLLLPDLIYRVNLEVNVSSAYVAEVSLGSKIRALVKAVARGSSQSMVKLRGEDIREWPVPQADQAAQKSFLDEMSEVSSRATELCDGLQRQRELLRERRQALIAAAVAGNCDVTTSAMRSVS